MIIEETVRNYLDSQLSCSVWLEIPEDLDEPTEYILVDKTGGNRENHINYATIAVQSHSKNALVDAISLNEEVKAVMLDHFNELSEVCRVELNSDQNFTNTQTKTYRYQAVFDIT